MGLSLSLLLSAWNEILEYNIFNSIGTIIGVKSNIGELVLRTSSFKKEDSETMSKSNESDKVPKPEKLRLRTSTPLNDLVLDNTITNPVSPNTKKRELVHKSKPDISLPEQFVFSSPRPISELDDAATKLQKVYKSYRTRRNLADCAVVVEELWWKALDFAALKQSSVSFFDIKKPETAASRWARATTRLAKVGKGLSKDEKAQKLALQHWLEAIDPRHRYGHNLHLYYDLWSSSKSSQPFFYWLDVGDGKELNHGSCSRIKLQHQCIQYLGPKEREEYEVIVENGKLVYKQNEMLLDTVEGSKWIFVLSTSRKFYVGQKNKGSFQHSSFLSGAATTAAGRLVAHNGILEAIWPYSGHYLPTEDNFNEFIIFLEENKLDLTNVKRCATDDDRTSFKVNDEDPIPEMEKDISAIALSIDKDVANANEAVNDISNTAANQEDKSTSNAANIEVPMFDSTRPLSCKWTSGVGPRIGCVRDYPANLQSQALEQMHLSPRVTFGRSRSYLPIPSPRPSPKIWVSPRLAYMGLPSPRVTISTQLKF